MRARIDSIIDGLLVICLATMALIVSANVFCRFVLNFSLYWADELAMIIFVWLTFLGAAVAVRENSHYVLNFLTEKLSGASQKVMLFVQKSLMTLAIVILLIFSSVVTWQIQSWIMPATEMSRAFVYGACPVGCVFMLYYAFSKSPVK